METNKGSITEEVENEPGNKNDKENDHGNGMPQEAKEENDEHYESVIESEVREVSSEARHGVSIWIRTGEGREVEEVAPWTESGTKRASGNIGAGPEGEIRGRGGGIRLTSGGGGECAVSRGGDGGHRSE